MIFGVYDRFVIMFRLLLTLSLVVALAAVCPLRCQADAARAVAGETAVEAEGCPCCGGGADEAPQVPASGECSDCVCEGAVDGPRVAAVELPPAVPPVDLPVVAAGLVRPAAGAISRLGARPDAPDGATLRLRLASLVI